MPEDQKSGFSEAVETGASAAHTILGAAGIICSHAPRSYFRRTDQCLFAI